jgi:hypothetical protein
MTNDLAVSMAELEGESAELLPSRETLNVCSHRSHGGTSSFSFTSVTQNGNQTGLINVGLLNFNGDTIIL